MVDDDKTKLTLDKAFDAEACRHTLEGMTMVLHCHHYSTLITQLAMDCGMLDATTMLAESSEDAWLELLSTYFDTHGIATIAERISLAEQTFAAVGLGKLSVTCAGPESGEVELVHSHLDESWVKKWGPSSTPVNFMGAGFISALFSAVFDKPSRTYRAHELESIVSGAERSRFSVVIR